MKKCPYCAEEIQDAAIKCKHCGEFLNGAMRPPSQLPAPERLIWYYRTSFILLTLACVGPLALPLIWWHPKLTRSGKIVATVAVLVITYVIYVFTMKSVHNIQTMYKELQAY